MSDDPQYILMSSNYDHVYQDEFRVKKIAELQSGDKILASLVTDNAYQSELRMVDFDEIGGAEVPTKAIGSTTEDNAYQGDLRIIDMPSMSCSSDCGEGWLDMLTPNKWGSSNNNTFNTETCSWDYVDVTHDECASAEYV